MTKPEKVEVLIKIMDHLSAASELAEAAEFPMITMMLEAMATTILIAGKTESPEASIN